jgi:hypothetical protein
LNKVPGPLLDSINEGALIIEVGGKGGDVKKKQTEE